MLQTDRLKIGHPPDKEKYFKTAHYVVGNEMFLDDLVQSVLSDIRDFAANGHWFFRELPDFYEPFKLRAYCMNFSQAT